MCEDLNDRKIRFKAFCLYLIFSFLLPFVLNTLIFLFLEAQVVLISGCMHGSAIQRLMNKGGLVNRLA